MSDSTSREDTAWVLIDTPLTVQQLTEFCADTARLLRINPLIEYAQLESVGDGQYQIAGNNESNQQDFNLELSIENTYQGFNIKYSKGLQTLTRVEIFLEGTGSRLKIIDDYSNLTAQEKNERLAEVDLSLVPWGNAIHRYLRSWYRWSWFMPWQWYMKLLWLPMKPSSRRVSNMVVWVTALEFIVFLMVFVIFQFEQIHTNVI